MDQEREQERHRHTKICKRHHYLPLPSTGAFRPHSIARPASTIQQHTFANRKVFLRDECLVQIHSAYVNHAYAQMWACGCVDSQMYGCMAAWTYGMYTVDLWIYRCMGAWIYGCMGAWIHCVLFNCSCLVSCVFMCSYLCQLFCCAWIHGCTGVRAASQRKAGSITTIIMSVINIINTSIYQHILLRYYQH